MRVAVIAGASGLVGSHLLRLLLDDPTWEQVLSIGRREVDVGHSKLQQHVVGFPSVGELPPVTEAFCALGTTIRKAGSQDAFRAIDHDAVLSFASAARDAGADSFLHVTSMGADPGSRLFYNRVKGETERDVAALGIRSTVAFRPSILDGARAEARPTEQAGLTMMRALAPLLGKYRPTRASDVARAMVRTAREGLPSTGAVEAGEITRLADAHDLGGPGAR